MFEDKVTEILEKWFNEPIDKPCAYCEATKEICQIFPKPFEVNYWKRKPKPALPLTQALIDIKEAEQPKADESRLLTDEEIETEAKKSISYWTTYCNIAKAQLAKDIEWDAKTAPIIKEETAREIFEEIEKYMIHPIGRTLLELYIEYQDWQALKKKYLKEMPK